MCDLEKYWWNINVFEICIPCGHSELCTKCIGDYLKNNKNCPMCQKIIQSHQKNYLR